MQRHALYLKAEGSSPFKSAKKHGTSDERTEERTSGAL